MDLIARLNACSPATKARVTAALDQGGAPLNPVEAAGDHDTPPSPARGIVRSADDALEAAGHRLPNAPAPPRPEKKKTQVGNKGVWAAVGFVLLPPAVFILPT